MPAMLDDMAIAHTAGTGHQALDTLIKPSLLIIDDYMLTQPTTSGVTTLLEITEQRLHVGSTIYCLFSRVRCDVVIFN